MHINNIISIKYQVYEINMKCNDSIFYLVLPTCIMVLPVLCNIIFIYCTCQNYNDTFIEIDMTTCEMYQFENEIRQILADKVIMFKTTVTTATTMRTIMINTIRNLCIKSASSPVSMSNFKERKVIIKNYEINYIKVGQGSHHVLCAPGGLGSIWTDFKSQIEGFDHKKFSLIVIDPPGYGRSINLIPDATKDLFRVYSFITYHFMKTLQISKYSYLGWSMGGAAGIIHAALNPDRIDKLILCGTCSFLYEHEMDQYKKMGDVNTWSQPTANVMKELYGEENYGMRVKKWSDAMVDYYYSNQGILNTVVKDVKCPTLILHGAKDPVVDPSHALYLQKNIKNSRLHVYPEGKHNIHIRYAEDFNRRVQDFLLEP